MVSHLSGGRCKTATYRAFPLQYTKVACATLERAFPAFARRLGVTAYAFSSLLYYSQACSVRPLSAVHEFPVVDCTRHTVLQHLVLARAVGTSLMRRRTPSGPYIRTVPMALRWPWGGSAALYEPGKPVCQRPSKDPAPGRPRMSSALTLGPAQTQPRWGSIHGGDVGTNKGLSMHSNTPTHGRSMRPGLLCAAN